MHKPENVEIFVNNLLEATNALQTALCEWLKHNLDGKAPSISLVPFTKSFIELLNSLVNNPNFIFEIYNEYNLRYLDLVKYTTNSLFGLKSEPIFIPQPKDYRFNDPIWSENPVFDHIKQSYLMCNQFWNSVLDNAPNLDKVTIKRARLLIKIIQEAYAPSNMTWLNPAVLRETIITKGENFVKGMQNLVHDMQNSNEYLDITRTDKVAFKLGHNLAITKGKVVFENHLMQLIYYEPAGHTTYDIPILIVPPWINKYYILDLQPHNSIVKWLVDQGYAVFLISWVNPDASYANVNFEDYLKLGILAAADYIKQHTQAESIHPMGYCIGGTLLTCALAYCAEYCKKENYFSSATLMASLVDFEDAGDLCLFLDEEHIEKIEARMHDIGFLDGVDMNYAFSIIRANDMIWSFIINNYLLGKDPFPFDMLYWNADSTRMPAKMYSFYVRKMYQQNLLKEPEGLYLLNKPISVQNVQIPLYIIGAIDDHITPWENTYAMMNLTGGKTTYILSGSGHVAGILNHPNSKKYNYWISKTNTKYPSPSDWFQHTTSHKGSWFLYWHAQQKEKLVKTDKIVKAMKNVKAIEPAPGRYVKQRYKK